MSIKHIESKVDRLQNAVRDFRRAETREEMKEDARRILKELEETVVLAKKLRISLNA